MSGPGCNTVPRAPAGGDVQPGFLRWGQQGWVRPSGDLQQVCVVPRPKCGCGGSSSSSSSSASTSSVAACSSSVSRAPCQSGPPCGRQAQQWQGKAGERARLEAAAASGQHLRRHHREPLFKGAAGHPGGGAATGAASAVAAAAGDARLEAVRGLLPPCAVVGDVLAGAGAGDCGRQRGGRRTCEVSSLNCNLSWRQAMAPPCRGLPLGAGLTMAAVGMG